MSAAAAVPMSPEGFAAMVARHVRNWGSKALALVKTPARFAARVARRLHVTQAVRWTAGIAKSAVRGIWRFARVPIMLAVPPIAAVVYAPQFVAILLGLTILGFAITGVMLWRLHKALKKKAPEEVQDLVEDLRRRIQEEEERSRVRVRARKQRAPEPEPEDDEDVVEGEVIEGEVLITGGEGGLEIIEEILEESVEGEPVDDGVIIVEEVIEQIHDAQAAKDEAIAQPLPDEVDGKELPIPYQVLSARWTNLTQMAEEAHEVDPDLYSEISGRLAVVLVRTGHPDNKLYADASWSDIHRENRAQLEAEQPDYPWNLTRMSKGSQAEVKLLKELAAKARATS